MVPQKRDSIPPKHTVRKSLSILKISRILTKIPLAAPYELRVARPAALVPCAVRCATNGVIDGVIAPF